MNRVDESIEYNHVSHLTTFSMPRVLKLNPESSDGFTGQGSWIQFVRRAWSRQTKSSNSTNYRGQK